VTFARPKDRDIKNIFKIKIFTAFSDFLFIMHDNNYIHGKEVDACTRERQKLS